MAKLKIDRGTTYKRSGTVRDDSKQPISLVGSTIRFTVKTSEFDSDTDDNSAVIMKNITNGTIDGTYEITIEPGDTSMLDPDGDYFYDIKLKQADGTVFKLDEGTIKFDGSPTNRLT